MSWDPYITTLTQKDEKGEAPVRMAAIWGIKDSLSCWASTPGFQVTEEQVRVLLGNTSTLIQNGPTIGHYKCRFLRDNKETEGLWCFDLKTKPDAEGNSYNICVSFSITAMILGVGTKEASGGQISARLFKITDYLRKMGM